MVLLLRMFRSKPGRERRMIEALQDTATRMIHDRQVDAVLICQQRDELDRILWIENCARETGHNALFSKPEASWEFFEPISAPCHLEFLDGFYRFPLPPCRVWWLKIDQPLDRQLELVQGLLDLARRAAADAHVVGVSLYRAVDEPTMIIGFLALTLSVMPAEYFKEELPFAADADAVGRAVAWSPLSVSWSVGRFSVGASSLISPSRYPRTAFWARSASPCAPPGAPPALRAIATRPALP